METSLPTPTTTRVYVNLPEGTQRWRNPHYRATNVQRSQGGSPWCLLALRDVEGDLHAFGEAVASALTPGHVLFGVEGNLMLLDVA